MDNQNVSPNSGPNNREPTTKQAGVDIVQLTAAVERLMRRDMVLARERLHGNKRSTNGSRYR